MVLWRPTRPSRINIKKGVLLIIGDWNAKGGSQEIPRVTSKFGLGVQNEAGQRLTEFFQEDALVIAKTALYMNITRWPNQNKIDYILCSRRWRSSIQSAKTRLGAHSGSDHELLISKFRLRFITLYGRQWQKPPPRKGNARGQNGFLRRFYQIAEKIRSKRQGETERCTHLNAEFQSIVRKDKKAFLNAKK